MRCVCVCVCQTCYKYINLSWHVKPFRNRFTTSTTVEILWELHKEREFWGDRWCDHYCHLLCFELKNQSMTLIGRAASARWEVTFTALNLNHYLQRSHFIFRQTNLFAYRANVKCCSGWWQESEPRGPTAWHFVLMSINLHHRNYFPWSVFKKNWQKEKMIWASWQSIIIYI